MMLPDYVTDCIHKIAKSEGFTEYRIETKAGSSHGDNFLGIMTAIMVTGTHRKNGKTQPEELHLLCKAPPTNKIRQKNFNSQLAFSREIYVYTKLLPAFIRFQEEKGLNENDSFRSFPRVFACETNEEKGYWILIMEDLRSKKFEMWPKEKTVPLEHELYIMRELGKFHAISFAMKDQRPNEFQEFMQLKDAFIGVFLKTTLKSFIPLTIDRCIDALKKPEHKKIMHKFKESFWERSEQMISESFCHEFGVITHGDCWNNNFLFQYSDNTKMRLKSICFVDWQLTHYSPPVIDILYNIFSGTDKSFRDLHYEQLLKTYHASLSETIRKLGSDPNKWYTYENLQMQLRKYSDYALLLAPMIILIRVAKAKDISNLDDYAECLERNEEVDILGKLDEETQAEFSRQINDLIIDLVNYGYLKCE